jgi:hypothetical protein
VKFEKFVYLCNGSQEKKTLPRAVRSEVMKSSVGAGNGIVKYDEN